MTVIRQLYGADGDPVSSKGSGIVTPDGVPVGNPGLPPADRPTTDYPPDQPLDRVTMDDDGNVVGIDRMSPQDFYDGAYQAFLALLQLNPMAVVSHPAVMEYYASSYIPTAAHVGATPQGDDVLLVVLSDSEVRSFMQSYRLLKIAKDVIGNEEALVLTYRRVPVEATTEEPQPQGEPNEYEIVGDKDVDTPASDQPDEPAAEQAPEDAGRQPDGP